MTRAHSASHSTNSAQNGSPLRGLAINRSLGVSLIALGLAAAFVFMALATVLSAAFAGGTREVDAGEEVGKLVAKNQENMKVFQDRFNGRSVFFKPPAPPLERKPPAVVRETKPPPPPVDTTPAVDPKYTGPSIIYAIGELVRFKPKTNTSKPMDIRVGEELEGVRVVGVSLPWSVRVGYKGGEYDVPIFARMGDKYLVASAEPVTLVPGIIEVLAPKHEVEIPKGTTIVDSGGIKEPADPAAARQGRTAAGRTAAAPPRQAPQPPPRAANARTATAEDEEEEDPEPSDPETETDDDEPEGARPGRGEAEEDEDDAGAGGQRERDRRNPARPRPQPRNPGERTPRTPSH